MTIFHSASTPRAPLDRAARRSPTFARRSAALFALLALGVSASAHAYPLKFPARGDSLPNGVYFKSNGHTENDYGNQTWGIDISAVAYVNSKWTGYPAGIDPATASNEDHFAFGAPVFAPEDGEIIACWRTAPDKPSPTTHYDFDGDGVDGEKDDDKSPVAGGNHLQIRTVAGDYIIYLAHMQSGSIPAELCPLPASRDANGDGWPDNRTKSCSLGSSWRGYQAGTILPTPVPIKAGDFLGRVGHSGASDGPHLHLHVKPFASDAQGRPCEGPSEEIEFVEAWAQVCDDANVTAAGWDALESENPLEPWVWMPELNGWMSTPRQCFLPDAFGPQQDHNDYGEPAANIQFATHSSGDLVVYQSGNALRLRSYKLQADGTIVDQSVISEGAVLDVAVARPRGERNVVVSIRGSNGNLKHIPYAVSAASGAITRQTGKELGEGPVLQVESTPSPAHGGFVVAIEDSAGKLKVIDYHVDAGLNIARNVSSSGSGGAIDDVAITTVKGSFEGVVTAEITAGGYLGLRSFEVPAEGGVFAADTTTTLIAGDSVTVDTVPVMFGLVNYVVTGVRQSSDQTLRLDTWAIDETGELTWVDTISAGAIAGHDATSTVAGGDLVSVVRDAQDNFRMIGWKIDALGGITRNATRGLSAVSSAAIVAPLGAPQKLVAARTDAQGELHLFSYGAAFTPGL